MKKNRQKTIFQNMGFGGNEKNNQKNIKPNSNISI